MKTFAVTVQTATERIDRKRQEYLYMAVALFLYSISSSIAGWVV